MCTAGLSEIALGRSDDRIQYLDMEIVLYQDIVSEVLINTTAIQKKPTFLILFN